MDLSNLTKAKADNLLNLITATLNEGLKEHGLKATCKGGQYGPGSLTVKLGISSDNPEEAANADRAEWTKYAHMFGLKPEHFGFQFKRQGVLVEFVGLALNRRKFPVRVREVLSGRVYLITLEEAEMRVKLTAHPPA